MVDRRADLAAAVLEHEHVLDLGPREQRFGARRPTGRRPCGPARRRASRATRRARVRTARPRTRRRPAADRAAPLRPRRSRSARPGASAGQRLANQRTSYGSGASSPPTQNGQPSSGRFGRAWRWPTMLTHSPVSGSKRISPCARGSSSSASPFTSPYLQDGAEVRTVAGAHQIRKMTLDDCPAVARVQARAFFDDPLQVVGAARRRRRGSAILEQVFELLSRYSSVPRGESYTDESRRDCGVLGAARPVRARSPEAADAMAPILDMLGDANARFRAAEDAMRKHRRPADVHFYLQGLGTDPPRQGEGLGVGRRCSRCSTAATRDGMPAYLESTKERNVALLRAPRLRGHRLRRRSPLDGPPMWFMWREPAADACRPQLGAIGDRDELVVARRRSARRSRRISSMSASSWFAGPPAQAMPAHERRDELAVGVPHLVPVAARAASCASTSQRNASCTMNVTPSLARVRCGGPATPSFASKSAAGRPSRRTAGRRARGARSHAVSAARAASSSSISANEPGRVVDRGVAAREIERRPVGVVQRHVDAGRVGVRRGRSRACRPSCRRRRRRARPRGSR